MVLSAHHASLPSLPSPQTSLTGNLKKPLFSPRLLSGEKLCPVACLLTLPEGSRWDVFKQTYRRLHSHDSSQSLDSWDPESQLSTSQPPNCRCFATSSHTPSSPTYLSHHLWQPPQVTSPAGRWAADCKLAVCIGAWKGLRQKQESRASLSLSSGNPVGSYQLLHTALLNTRRDRSRSEPLTGAASSASFPGTRVCPSRMPSAWSLPSHHKTWHFPSMLNPVDTIFLHLAPSTLGSPGHLPATKQGASWLPGTWGSRAFQTQDLPLWGQNQESEATRL